MSRLLSRHAICFWRRRGKKKHGHTHACTRGACTSCRLLLFHALHGPEQCTCTKRQVPRLPRAKHETQFFFFCLLLLAGVGRLSSSIFCGCLFLSSVHVAAFVSTQPTSKRPRRTFAATVAAPRGETDHQHHKASDRTSRKECSSRSACVRKVE